jgi:hypothetical protein
MNDSALPIQVSPAITSEFPVGPFPTVCSKGDERETRRGQKKKRGIKHTSIDLGTMRVIIENIL